MRGHDDQALLLPRVRRSQLHRHFVDLIDGSRGQLLKSTSPVRSRQQRDLQVHASQEGRLIPARNRSGFCIRRTPGFVNNSSGSDPGNSRGQRLHSDSTNVAYPGGDRRCVPLEEPVDVRRIRRARGSSSSRNSDRILRFQPTGRSRTPSTRRRARRRSSIRHRPRPAMSRDDSLVFLPIGEQPDRCRELTKQ